MRTLRFQFPYTEAGRRAPDRPQILEATWRAAIAAAHNQATRIAVGGRSMGGRIASQVVAQGASVDALALFAYPLHPPGRPGQRRDAHLASIGIPTLFCSGTRDAFASPDELRSLAEQVPRAQLCLLPAADHGFSTPRASGRTRVDVWQEAAEGFLNWLQAITHG
jgi:predicted alpha/beta-hydrolase family hydrolase